MFYINLGWYETCGEDFFKINICCNVSCNNKTSKK